MEKENNNYLIEKFSRANKGQRLEILGQLAINRDEATVHFLITCLTDEYWSVRKVAADRLREYGEAIVPILSGTLNSQNHDLQHWSLNILSEFGDKGYPAILRAMKSSNDEIRYFAATALGNAKVSQGVTLLLKALGDERWRVRKAASDALVKYGEVIIEPLQQVLSLTDDEDIRFWTIKTLGKLGPKAQKFLIEALKSGDKQTRYVIATALGESGDTRVIRLLIESLADPDWTIRKSSTMALAEIGDNAVSMMIEYLGGTDENIREGCLRALVKAGSKSLQTLFDEIVKMDENKRFLIRNSIIKIGNRVVEPLIRLFKDSSPDVQVFAASALGEIGNPRSVSVLVTGLSSTNWNVRRSCAFALTEIGERGVEMIAEALSSTNDDVRYWVTRILESIGDAGVPYLVKGLTDSNKEIRFFSAKALGSSFEPGTTRALISALNDSIWGVRKSAAESLCNLDNLHIEEVLRHISSDNEDIRYWIGYVVDKVGKKHQSRIIKAMRRGDPELRLFAAQAAGIIGGKDFIAPLTEALRDDNEWVRVYSAISLGQIGDVRSIVPMVRCFSDRNNAVQRNVLAAFERLGKEVVVPELLKCFDSDDVILKKNAAKALAQMKESKGLDQIIMLTDDSDVEARLVAIEALGAFNSEKSRTVLKSLLDDQANLVRTATIKSLGKLGTSADVEILIDFIEVTQNELEQRTIRRILADVALRNPDYFIGMFKRNSHTLRTLANEILVMAGVEVLSRLSEVVAESDDNDVVEYCKKVIKQIKLPQESMFYG
jgi:HEAT repeat protein